MSLAMRPNKVNTEVQYDCILMFPVPILHKMPDVFSRTFRDIKVIPSL